MALERIAQKHYRRSSSTTRQVVEAVLAIWNATGPSGFRDELVRAAGLLAAGQLSQAVQAAAYLAALTDWYGMDAAPTTVVPRAFAGTSSAGAPLTDVLGYAITRAEVLSDAGADLATATTSATATLTRIAANETTQAGVSAERIGMVGQSDFSGYARILSPPSCGRCAVLAGKWFQWNTGFARHPGCDCRHVPAPAAADVTQVRADPRAYFNALSPAQQDHYFGRSEAEAIRGGADLAKAVNATTVRGSRSGLSTPRSIERLIAGKSRADAIDVLTRYGLLAA